MRERTVLVLLVVVVLFVNLNGCGPNNKVRLQQALANAKQKQTPYAQFRLSDISARNITSEEKLAAYSDKLVAFTAVYLGRPPANYADGEYTVHLISEVMGSPMREVRFLEDAKSPLYGESWRQYIGKPMTIWAIIQYTPPPSFWENLGTGMAKAALSGAVSGTQKGLAKQGYQLNPELNQSLSNIKAAADAPAGEENGVVEFYAQMLQFTETVGSAAPAPSLAPLINELLQQAMLANSKGDYQSAIHYTGEALKQKQDLAPAYVTRGEAFLGLRQAEQAIGAFLNGLGSDPQLSANLFGLAEAYWLLADKGRSQHYYKLFLNSPDPYKEKWRVDRAGKMLQM